MDQAQEFRPPRQKGVSLNIGFLLLFGAGMSAVLLIAFNQQNRSLFFAYLILSVILFIPIPIILYRLLSLLRAKYVLNRDGLHLQWGLRTEDIPMAEIEWIRRPEEIGYNLPLPRFHLPGGLLGMVFVEGLGEIEYLASEKQPLLLIATASRIFVISPANDKRFLAKFREFSEMGSIQPIHAQSSRAELLVTSLFKDRPSRIFIIAGSIMVTVLLLAATLIIPTRETVPLGFNLRGSTGELSPSERLLLLPLLAFFAAIADLGFGAYLYRKTGFRMASYMAFASMLILPISFIALLVLIII
jgi:hypothetical protein